MQIVKRTTATLLQLRDSTENLALRQGQEGGKHIAALSESIGKHGYDPSKPIVVCVGSEPNTYDVISGHNRKAAIQVLAAKDATWLDFKIPVEIRKYDDAADRIADLLRLNPDENRVGGMLKPPFAGRVNLYVSTLKPITDKAAWKPLTSGPVCFTLGYPPAGSIQAAVPPLVNMMHYTGTRLPEVVQEKNVTSQEFRAWLLNTKAEQPRGIWQRFKDAAGLGDDPKLADHGKLLAVCDEFRAEIASGFVTANGPNNTQESKEAAAKRRLDDARGKIAATIPCKVIGDAVKGSIALSMAHYILLDSIGRMTDGEALAAEELFLKGQPVILPLAKIKHDEPEPESKKRKNATDGRKK